MFQASTKHQPTRQILQCFFLHVLQATTNEEASMELLLQMPRKKQTKKSIHDFQKNSNSLAIHNLLCLYCYTKAKELAI
jgi:hypothetical protein